MTPSMCKFDCESPRSPPYLARLATCSMHTEFLRVYTVTSLNLCHYSSGDSKYLKLNGTDRHAVRHRLLLKNKQIYCTIMYACTNSVSVLAKLRMRMGFYPTPSTRTFNFTISVLIFVTKINNTYTIVACMLRYHKVG